MTTHRETMAGGPLNVKFCFVVDCQLFLLKILDHESHGVKSVINLFFMALLVRFWLLPRTIFC